MRMKKFMNNAVFSTDKDKQLLYICRVSGNCKNLIALLVSHTDIDINAAKYVSILEHHIIVLFVFRLSLIVTSIFAIFLLGWVVVVTFSFNGWFRGYRRSFNI